VFVRAQAQQASTEDLRSAMLQYRSLFDQLLIGDTTSPEGNVAESATSRTSMDTAEGAL